MTIIDCTPKSNKTGGLPAGCWDRYKSKEYFGTEEGHVLAPWVAIDFVDQQKMTESLLQLQLAITLQSLQTQSIVLLSKVLVSDIQMAPM